MGVTVRPGISAAHLSDTVGKVMGTAVALVVAVDRRNHHVLQTHARDRLCEVPWLGCVER